MTKRVQRSRRAFVRTLAGGSLLSFAKGSIPLAVPNRQPYSIFLSNQASPSERWAAEELRRLVEQMTGTQLRIDVRAGMPASRKAIAIGGSELTELCGVKPPEGESCVLKTAGETIIIAGGRQRGTMYGVSIFLEKLGCRWFTADVARIPQIKALWLPELNEVHSPAFEYREVFFTEAQGREWSARNRLNGHFHQLDESAGGKITFVPFAHSFYDLVPPDRYFSSRPEYFALVDGKRRREHAQLCLTNAEVLRLAVGQAEQWLAAQPDAAIVSISQNDGGGWCECEPCRQVMKDEGGAASGLALRFVNQVAERLAASHPGKVVDMLAYQETADPPSTVRPRSNVQIRYCPIDACQAHSYTRCVYNRTVREQIERWSRIAPRLHIWQYSVNFSHYLAPFPNYDQLISDIPMFRRVGFKGVFIEGAVSEGGGGDDAELRSYLAARLLWNPDLDAVVEIREFLNAVYGPAAPLMWNYFTLRQREVRRGQHLWIDQNMDARYLTPDFLKRGRALLDGASRQAATEAARRRIERQILSIDYVEAMRARRCIIQGRSYGPADPALARRNTQEVVTNAERLGIANFREGYPITKQASDWSDAPARYAAVLLSDGAAMATVVPELDGRIISLGRSNILRVSDPGEWRYPRAGGIWVSLYEGGAPRTIAWQIASTTPETLELTGGSALHMQIAIAGEVLRVRVTVSNPTDRPARLKFVCRAEFACRASREALLTYRDRSGNERTRRIDAVDGGVVLAEAALPQQDWTLACKDSLVRVKNRFRVDEVSQCALSWSFRGSAGLDVSLSVASPEVELAPGQQLALTSEYEL